jgi:hypothetical protein
VIHPEVKVFASLFWQEVLAPTEWLVLGLAASLLTEWFGVLYGVGLLVVMWLVVCTWCSIAAYRYVRDAKGKAQDAEAYWNNTL